MGEKRKHCTACKAKLPEGELRRVQFYAAIDMFSGPENFKAGWLCGPCHDKPVHVGWRDD